MERQPELGRPLGSEGRDYIMMRGAYLPGNSSVVLRDLPVPEPGHGEVLLRMKASTICGSDIRCIYHEHRSEEHTSELQSLRHLVCRLLLEKKKIKHRAPLPDPGLPPRTRPHPPASHR